MIRFRWMNFHMCTNFLSNYIEQIGHCHLGAFIDSTPLDFLYCTDLFHPVQRQLGQNEQNIWFIKKKTGNDIFFADISGSYNST